MESCLTLNPHHSTACTGNTASNFFHQDAVSEHLVTLWADLPVIYQECRQMCWKFYLGTTQISVCFANSDPEKREFSTLYSLKGCFARPGHSPVFLRYSSQSFKQRKNLQFPTDLFLALWSPAMLSPPGQKTENPYSFFLHSLFSILLENSTHIAACTACFPELAQTQCTRKLPQWSNFAVLPPDCLAAAASMTSLGIRLSGNGAKALKRVKANACTLLACAPKKYASQVAWILFQSALLFGVGGGEGFLKHSPDKSFLLLE